MYSITIGNNNFSMLPILARTGGCSAHGLVALATRTVDILSEHWHKIMFVW